MQHLVRGAALQHLIGIFGNVFFIYLYARALVQPNVYPEFFLTTAFVIFMFEFMALHAGAMIGALRFIKKRLLFIVIVEIIAALFIGLAAGNPLLGLYFIASVILKAVSHPKPKDVFYLFVGIVGLLGSLAITVVFSALIEAVIATPADEYRTVYGQLFGSNIEGTNMLMVQGLLYFVYLACIEVVLFLNIKPPAWITDHLHIPDGRGTFTRWKVLQEQKVRTEETKHPRE